MWTLCLTNAQGRKVVTLEPTTTLLDLHEVAEEQYGKPVVALKYGFPPKLAPRNNTYCIQDILQNQERIQVELHGMLESSSHVTHTHKETSLQCSSPTQRPKREAALRATETMPSMIRAQDDMMERQSKSTNKRTRTASRQASPRNKRTSQPPHFTPAVGEGRRLADGVAVAPPATNRKKRSTTLKTAAQTSDMSEALLGALNDSGKMGQVLRKGMKNAVLTSYETSRAFSRLAAIQAKTYTMTQEASTLTVSYQGSVDKTKTTENVDCIPSDVLKEVLKGIYATNQEALRPENLALLSPRVLWSLVHIFPGHASVSDIYTQLLPDLNWSFLRRRAQQLSEKALENLRQQQGGEEEDGEQALEAIAAVEHAMEHLQEHTATERKRRLAHAALSRLKASQQQESTEAGEWALITPSEEDTDELQECILAFDNMTTTDMSTLIDKLVRECQIRNWRELAHVPDPSALAKAVGEPVEAVQSWIAYAQGRSVDEIIVEICDDNVRAVELLTAKARSGTPKDLAAWRSIPEMLHKCIAGEEEENAPTVDELQRWSQRAFQLLLDHEWLNWYATPVE
jgi:hypothetical protein